MTVNWPIGAVAAFMLGASASVSTAQAGVVIQNLDTLECMALPAKQPLTGPLSLPCALSALTQFSLAGGRIVANLYVVQNGAPGTACMDLSGGVPGDPVVLNPCENGKVTQKWVIEGGHIVNHHLSNTLCMSRVNGTGQTISTETCIFSGPGAKDQTWTLN
jgi:hypothetical protein